MFLTVRMTSRASVCRWRGASGRARATSRDCSMRSSEVSRRPTAVRTDKGPPFIAKACLRWTQSHQITHILIQPGCPTQNARNTQVTERFNGSFRDECLKGHWFGSLAEASAESALATRLQRGAATQQRRAHPARDKLQKSHTTHQNLSVNFLTGFSDEALLLASPSLATIDCKCR